MRLGGAAYDRVRLEEKVGNPQPFRFFNSFYILGMSDAVKNEFIRLFEARPNYRARSWINIDCPACGDTRKRMGISLTDTGGFRISCFNGGCDFATKPTGWEPGGGLVGRVRHLFELLGGITRNIPFDELIPDKYRNQKTEKKKTNDVVWEFPEVDLPPKSILLSEAIDTNPDSLPVAEYLLSRGEHLWDLAPWVWTPTRKDILILPYLDQRGKVVGYLGRNIKVTEGPKRFIQKCPKDYLFNQHLLSTQAGSHIFVMESPWDALVVRGVGSRESRLTQKQINILKQSGKQIVLIPDLKSNEWEPYLELVRQENFGISIPSWGKGIKDVGESVKHNGLLYTVESITKSITLNYVEAKAQLLMRTS